MQWLTKTLCVLDGPTSSVHVLVIKTRGGQFAAAIARHDGRVVRGCERLVQPPDEEAAVKRLLRQDEARILAVARQEVSKLDPEVADELLVSRVRYSELLTEVVARRDPHALAVLLAAQPGALVIRASQGHRLAGAFCAVDGQTLSDLVTGTEHRLEVEVGSAVIGELVGGLPVVESRLEARSRRTLAELSELPGSGFDDLLGALEKRPTALAALEAGRSADVKGPRFDGDFDGVTVRPHARGTAFVVFTRDGADDLWTLWETGNPPGLVAAGRDKEQVQRVGWMRGVACALVEDGVRHVCAEVTERAWLTGRRMLLDLGAVQLALDAPAGLRVVVSRVDRLERRIAWLREELGSLQEVGGDLLAEVQDAVNDEWSARVETEAAE